MSIPKHNYYISKPPKRICYRLNNCSILDIRLTRAVIGFDLFEVRATEYLVGLGAVPYMVVVCGVGGN